MSSGRTILITGASGQVGYEVCRLAGELNVEFVGLEHKQLDITAPDSVRGEIIKIKPSLVINCAAYTAVDKAETEKDLAFAVNRDGAANLARSCAELRIPLIHISTDYVFDGEKDSPYVEDDETNPKGVYGLSKLQGEVEIRKILKEHLLIRTSWVFGSHGNNFVKTILRLAERHDELRVVVDQSGCPTYSKHIAEILLMLGKNIQTKEKIHWGTYHYCGTPVTNWHHFAEVVLYKAKQLGIVEKTVPVVPIKTKEYPTPAQRPKNSALDCRKINSVFGISQPDWQQGMDYMLRVIV